MASRSPRRARRGVRVLVGLGETAGYCASLTDGLLAAGIAADHVNLGADPMRYAERTGGRLVRTVRWLGRRRRHGPGPSWAWAIPHRFFLAWLFLHAIARYDAFIFRAGDSFFALRDLSLLRRIGKSVIVIFFGTDSRPSYLSGAEIAAGQDGRTASGTTAAKHRMVERIERSATHVVCHPLSAQLHRRPSIAFLEMGIPRAVPPLPATPVDRSQRVRFLHAPSRPQDKGSELVRAAVAEVQAEGIDVELRVVTGRPNAEILEAIAECDVVIDQPWSDTPMAALAAEAASLGRPAIVGGYGWEAVRAMTSDVSLPPTHLCRPSELADAIRRLASDPAYRRDLGGRARAFVEERWSPEIVANRYLALLSGEALESWWFEPGRVTYVHGAGAPVEAVRNAVRGVLQATGPHGLHVDDKPHLVERLIALADEPSEVGG